MHNTVTGKDFKEMQKTVSEHNLEWNKMQCMTNDGGKNMSGVKIDVAGQITKVCEINVFSKSMFATNTTSSTDGSTWIDRRSSMEILKT